MLNSIDDLTVEQYLEWKKKKYSDAKILSMLNYSKNSASVMRTWKMKNGLIKPQAKKNNPLDDFSVREFMKYKHLGKTNDDIAAWLNVHVSTLYEWIKHQKNIGNLSHGKQFPVRIDALGVEDGYFREINVESDCEAWF